MTHTNTIKAFAVTTAVFLSLGATAFAGTATFAASFAYDSTLSAETNYVNFQTKAAATCKAQVRKAGYPPQKSEQAQPKGIAYASSYSAP